MWLAGIVGVAYGGECSGPASAAAVERQLAAAEAAFVALDASGFVTATDGLVLLAPCVDAILPPALAARWHRVRALQLHGAGDASGAEDALRAARALEPAYAWPDELLPPGALRTAYDAAPIAGAFVQVPEPRDGTLAFDGAPGRLRPLDRATVVQLLDPAGRASGATWLDADDPLPAYRAIPRTRNALLTVAGVAGAGTVASLAGAVSARHAFATWTPDPASADPTTSEAHLRALRGNANGLLAGAVVLGVVSAGGVTGAVLVGER